MRSSLGIHLTVVLRTRSESWPPDPTQVKHAQIHCSILIKEYLSNLEMKHFLARVLVLPMERSRQIETIE